MECLWLLSTIVSCSADASNALLVIAGYRAATAARLRGALFQGGCHPLQVVGGVVETESEDGFVSDGLVAGDRAAVRERPIDLVAQLADDLVVATLANEQTR